MGHADYWAPGDYNAICDECGFKFKASELRRRWDGLMVCEADWEPRQPQDFVRGVKDQRALPFTRPESTDTFILSCTLNGRTAFAGVAVAGCSIAGNVVGYDPNVT